MAPLPPSPVSRGTPTPPTPVRHDPTFYDGTSSRNHHQSEHHQQQQQQQHPRGAEDVRAAKSGAPLRRWSYVMQDIPRLARTYLNDVNRGYALRLFAVSAFTVGGIYAMYHGILAPHQERKPLAQRWWIFSRPVPITLVEKYRVEADDSSNMFIYRFSLPNNYDYAGYEPVSSVKIISGQTRELSSLSRWYTPISHPEQRGIIEFAIKDCDPGRMSARLRYLERGDVVYLGRWMKEYRFRPQTTTPEELGIMCSTGGASIALQLMRTIVHEVKHGRGASMPRLQVLYCHHQANTPIPFKKEFFDVLEKESDGHVIVRYNVLDASGNRRRGTSAVEQGLRLNENLFIGHLDPQTIRASMPPPLCLRSSSTSPDATDEAQKPIRSHLLVCGPQSMLAFVCGRVSAWSNFYYWQGPMYRYHGFLRDMGYGRDQVYKFGVSTHFLAMH